MGNRDTFDFIVVGAGSAGCVIANRLSANLDHKVLLLEAGGRDLNPLFRLPMLMGKLFHSGIYNWHYHTEPEQNLNGRSLYWPRGKVLGGTSTINGMLFVRGNRSDYDRWAQMGCTGWSFDEVLPAFLKSESHVERHDAYHGASGELTVCRARGWNSLLEVFTAAGREAGYPLNDDFNGETQEGFGKYDFTIRKGKRWSTAPAFLNPVRSRPNLTIVTRAHARRILLDGDRATGIEFVQGGSVRQAQASREVILAAGVVCPSSDKYGLLAF
jgi:choline dehydrogenase